MERGGYAMSEEFIVAQAAPTLAGMKTGSLFGCPYRDKAALYAEVSGWNRRLVPLDSAFCRFDSPENGHCSISIGRMRCGKI